MVASTAHDWSGGTWWSGAGAGRSSHRINVNVVAAGTIVTEINLPLYQSTKPEDIEKRTAVLHCVPWGEIGQPEDIGRAVAFLASDAARYITGAVVYVDGGYTADGTPRLPSGARVP
jgi:NAD(P)-dependent dehydrogenase (short-subunit alcohol dehydrogenase family)